MGNGKRKVPLIEICENCGKEKENFSYSHHYKFCSLECQKEFTINQSINNWLSGKIKGYTGTTKNLKRFIRVFLKKSRGSACSKCSWDGKHPIDNLSLTEINHIDGNAENCKPDNLEILCPNCHSMTSNFRARNKISTRNRS